jgi:hypothetical protein
MSKRSMVDPGTKRRGQERPGTVESPIELSVVMPSEQVVARRWNPDLQDWNS